MAFPVNLSQTITVGKLDLGTNIIQLKKKFFFLFIFIFSLVNTPAHAQSEAPAAAPATDPAGSEEINEGGGTTVKILNGLPSGRRIRRHLNLVAGVKHDEEFLIPSVPLSFKGSVDLVEMQRIKDTDIFRILPTKMGNGIITIHNQKTGQVYVEMRLDIREQSIEKSLREIKALLGDIEGIEFKIVNGKILLDGFVLLPKDLIRIANVIKQFGIEVVRSLVTLSPLARKKIIEYVAKDINNPEVTVTAVGDFIKAEGIVNSAEEKSRILDLISLYMPDMVVEKTDGLENVDIRGRRQQGDARSFIIDLITIRKQEDKVEPPPKMIQVVVHFVEFSDRYLKSFQFLFMPSITGVGEAFSRPRPPTTVGEIANIVDNLLPKISWARNHGFIRVLDTASILTQNSNPAMINRVFNVSNNNAAGSQPAGAAGAPAGGGGGQSNFNTTMNLNVTPTIKQERSGLVELTINASITPTTTSISPTTTVQTKIAVHDRQSAAFGGIINKKSANDYGGPTDTRGAIITMNHAKKYEKSNGNFVVFVTPIIKSSASAGVEQVKKKFRMKE